MVGRLENQNNQEKYPSQEKFISQEENHAPRQSDLNPTLRRERAKTAGMTHPDAYFL
jgi:hypothetical protein